MLESSPFLQLVFCNIRGYLREPEAIFWSYGFPLLMVIGLGIAFGSSTSETQRFDVIEGRAAGQVLPSLSNHPGFEATVSSEKDAFQRLRQNRTALVVGITPSGELEYHYDPTNPEAKLLRQAVDDLLQQAAGRADPVLAKDVLVNTPGSRYVDFLVPGLIGMTLMGGGMWGVGFMLVDMRIKKLLKRLLGTPMRRPQFLLSVVATRIVFFVPEAFILLIAAYLIFDIPIQGSLVAVLVIAFVGAMTFSGMGLLAGSRAQRIESITGVLNVTMMPMWLCSGIFFSAERFPDAMQPFIQALPLTQLINALRAVILEGQSLPQQWMPLSILAIWTGCCMALALKLFRWN